jgi:hypothetical protein
MDLLVIILAVALALLGLIGGMCFWEKMAESAIWEQIRKCVKIVGLGGPPVLFATVIFLLWKMETQPPEFFRQYIFRMNIGSWFVLFYLLGYDASILRLKPQDPKNPHGKEKRPAPCHLKWDLFKKELYASIIAIVPAGALWLFSRIGIQAFGMWVAGVVGFAMGFFFWEHLKETGIFTGTFRRVVVILSLVTTAAIGYIAGYGLHVDFSAANPESIRTLLVSIILFFECMAWYMIGLCVVVFRIK